MSTNLTEDQKSLLRDAAGVGVVGGKPTRRNLSLYLSGQKPQDVAQLVDMGYLRPEDRGGVVTYYITDAGLDVGQDNNWWPR